MYSRTTIHFRFFFSDQQKFARTQILSAQTHALTQHSGTDDWLYPSHVHSAYAHTFKHITAKGHWTFVWECVLRSVHTYQDSSIVV